MVDDHSSGLQPAAGDNLSAPPPGTRLVRGALGGGKWFGKKRRRRPRYVKTRNVAKTRTRLQVRRSQITIRETVFYSTLYIPRYPRAAVGTYLLVVFRFFFLLISFFHGSEFYTKMLTKNRTAATARPWPLNRNRGCTPFSFRVFTTFGHFLGAVNFYQTYNRTPYLFNQNQLSTLEMYYFDIYEATGRQSAMGNFN